MTRGAACLVGLLAASCLPVDRELDQRRDPAGEHRLWLVMVFMNADSGGDPHEWILVDDLELMDSTPPGPTTHLVVQVSRGGRDPYDGAWRGTRRYYLDGLGDGDPVRIDGLRLEDPEGTVDPSSGEALADFALWAASRYPAEHRMLVVTAHGSGWRGLSPCDIEADPACLITIPDGELGAALGRISRDHGLDLVVLNACLMGMWETGFALRGSTRYAVTSEEMGGPLLGSWHDLLPRLALGPDDPRSLCRHIPAMLGGERTRANSAVRTCVDLEGHAALTAAVDALAGNALEDPRAAGALARGIADSLHFAKPAHHDLGDLAAIVAADGDAGERTRALAGGVLDALGSYVVAHASSPFDGIEPSHGVCGGEGEWGGCDRSTGVAVWAPVGEPRYLLPFYLEGPWCATRWDEALAASTATAR